MEKKQENAETQGVKKQKISKTYTLTQFKEVIKKLKELGWIDEKKEKELQELQEHCKQEYIKSL